MDKEAPPVHRERFLRLARASETSLTAFDIPSEAIDIPRAQVVHVEASTRKFVAEPKQEKRLKARQVTEMNFYRYFLGTEFASNWMPGWGKKWHWLLPYIGGKIPWHRADGTKDVQEHISVNRWAFNYHAITGAFGFLPWAIFKIVTAGLAAAVFPIALTVGSLYLCIWFRYIYLKKKHSGEW
ncbi:MAG: hypothetical protein AAB573_00660 [Patescibacteria group bacterium]